MLALLSEQQKVMTSNVLVVERCTNHFAESVSMKLQVLKSLERNLSQNKILNSLEKLRLVTMKLEQTLTEAKKVLLRKNIETIG